MMIAREEFMQVVLISLRQMSLPTCLPYHFSLDSFFSYFPSVCFEQAGNHTPTTCELENNEPYDGKTSKIHSDKNLYSCKGWACVFKTSYWDLEIFCLRQTK